MPLSHGCLGVCFSTSVKVSLVTIIGCLGVGGIKGLNSFSGLNLFTNAS